MVFGSGLDKTFREKEDGAMNGLEFFDFDEEDARKGLEEIARSGRNDKRICICGHSVARHIVDSGIVSCVAGKQPCPCVEIRAVLRAQNTRGFMRKTMGTGVFHALGSAVAQAVQDGVEIEWLIEQKCDKCGAEGKVSPCAVTRQGIIMDEATGYDKLLCVECRGGN